MKGFGYVPLLACGFLARVGAATPPPQWVSLGRGEEPCAAYVQAIDAMTPAATAGQGTAVTVDGRSYIEPGVAYVQFVLGYVTAANQTRIDGSKQIRADTTTVTLWIRKYCEVHPQASLTNAAGAFVAAQWKGLN